MTSMEKYMEDLREEGGEEGKKKRAIEIAKYLIKAGNSLNYEAAITGLNIKQLRKR